MRLNPVCSSLLVVSMAIVAFAQESLSTAKACVPSCRSGFTCVDGKCVELCNPPCPAGEKCDNSGNCVSNQPAAIMNSNTSVNTPLGSSQQQVPVQQEQQIQQTPVKQQDAHQTQQTVPILLDNIHHHKGFYLSMAMGIGFGDIDYSAQNSLIEGSYYNYDMSISGTGMPYDIKIGCAVAENFILSLDFIGRTIFSPSTQLYGTTINYSSASDNSFGLGATYYFMPANVFVNCTIGFGGLSLTSSDTTVSSQTGFALHLKVGKEWWVSKKWGIGVSGGYGLVTAADKPQAGNPLYSATITTNKFFVMLNTTYN